MVSRGGEFEVMQLARLNTPAKATTAKDRGFNNRILFSVRRSKTHTDSTARQVQGCNSRRLSHNFAP